MFNTLPIFGIINLRSIVMRFKLDLLQVGLRSEEIVELIKISLLRLKVDTVTAFSS